MGERVGLLTGLPKVVSRREHTLFFAALVGMTLFAFFRWTSKTVQSSNPHTFFVDHEASIRNSITFSHLMHENRIFGNHGKFYGVIIFNEGDEWQKRRASLFLFCCSFNLKDLQLGFRNFRLFVDLLPTAILSQKRTSHPQIDIYMAQIVAALSEMKTQAPKHISKNLSWQVTSKS